MDDFTLYMKLILTNRKALDIVHFHWYGTSHKNLLHEIVSILHFTQKLLLCKLFNIKIVWTAHNLFPHDTRRTIFQYVRRFILAQFSDLIIVHFNKARQRIGRLFHVKQGKIVCMHHGLYDAAYPNSINKEAARRYLSLERQKTIFLYFGRVRRYKNIEALIQAFKRIKQRDIGLVIAGEPADEHYAKELVELISGDDRIICHFRNIDGREVQFFFNSADCVILPYKNIFTSGTAMLALTFKKPVIMQEGDFSKEYFSSDNSILIESCTKDNLSRAITRFIEEKSRLIVSDDFISKYDWSKIIDELFKENIVRKVFTKKKPIIKRLSTAIGISN
jgi:glycosyltransferase involved in cell wall biosynthesis